MKLVKIKIKNFLSIKNEQVLKLNDGITSLVGLNEAGKTSVLKAMLKLNGNRIEQSEKNKKLKTSPSLISGYFRLFKDEIIKINDELDSIIKLDENIQYCVEIYVDDEDGVGYNFYYLNDNNDYINAEEIFIDTINKEIKKYVSIDDSINHNQNDYDGILEYIKVLSTNENNNKEELSKIETTVKFLKENSWSDSIPKYEFISFSAFNDVLKSKYTLEEVKTDKKVINILNIAGIKIEEIADDINSEEVFAIQDMESKYVDIVTNKFKEIFKQVDDDFKLKIKIDSATKSVFFSTQDKTTDTMSIPIDMRSEGFKWYLSIYLTLYNYIENNDINNKVLLLDEPNLYLHAEAQKDLLERVLKQEFKNIQIVYTTHSPYMIDPSNTNSIKIIEKDTQTNIYNSTRDYALKKENIKDVDALTPLMTALHLNIANELIANSNDNLIIIEGIQDMYLIKAIIKKLNYEDKFTSIKFMPCFGSEKVTFMFGYLFGLGYKTFILVDEDGAGRKTIKEITNKEQNNPIRERLYTYSIAFNINQQIEKRKKEDILLENLISKNDWDNIFKKKETIIYKEIFDDIDNIEFEQETLTNFKKLFDNLLKKVEEYNG